jgi:hypothetical protein
MKKFAVVLFVMFAWLFCSQTAKAQTSDLEQKVTKLTGYVWAHQDTLKEHSNLIKALLQCTDPTCVQKALKQKKVKNPPKKTGKKPPAKPVKAMPLPDPVKPCGKSCDTSELEQQMKKLQAEVADHKARIEALEAARAELVKADIQIRSEFISLLAQLGQKFPTLKLELNSLDILTEFRDSIAELQKDLKAEKEMSAARLSEILNMLEEMKKLYISAKNKQSTLRFQLSGMAAGHYDGDITRFFGMMSAELIIPMHRIFALSAGGALGRGPRGLGTMFRAGGEVGGIARFRFAGVGVWDFRHAGTITRWIGGTIGLGVNIPLYPDQPQYKRPPVELVLFLDAGLGWLAQYCKDSLALLGMAGAGIRF